MDVPRKWQFDRCIKAAIEALRTDEFEKLEESIQTNALIQLGFDPIKDADKIDVFFNPLTSTEFYKSLEIYVREHDYQINATELGSGFQNALVISIMKAFEERKKQVAIFLFEEPEMYLHPQMQRSLYKTLRKIGETNQVIYVTHSPHFVTIPEFEEIIITSKDSNGTDVKTSSIKATPELKDKFRKELDPERNELFFARRILIVEGDTEKLAFPEYAKRMDLDFYQVGSSIIEAGGKRDLKTYVDLALSFNIPVGFDYDTDSSDFNGKREEEQAFNESLEFYKKSGVGVFSFSSNFDAECKKFFGENQYQKYCEQYGKNKTQRARGPATFGRTVS